MFSSSVWQRNIRTRWIVSWGTWSYMFKAIMKFARSIIWTKWPEKHRCDYVFSLTLTLTIKVYASTEVHASTLCLLQASHCFQSHTSTDAFGERWTLHFWIFYPLSVWGLFCWNSNQDFLLGKKAFFNYFAHSRPFLWGGHPTFLKLFPEVLSTWPFGLYPGFGWGYRRCQVTWPGTPSLSSLLK